MKLNLNNLIATKRIAVNIAKVLPPKFVIAFNGELGAGKTTLIREILYGIGVKEQVKSPTFTYVEPYCVSSGVRIYHFDLYRFNDFIDWVDLGFDEYFLGDSICFIEWANKADALLPITDWVINITSSDQLDAESREIEIIAHTSLGEEVLAQFVSINS